jgi:hypothetical protein
LVTDVQVLLTLYSAVASFHLRPCARTLTPCCEQGRGAASGWEYTVGLIAANDDDYSKTNKKAVPARKGLAELQVDVVDSGTKEIGGTFRMLQVGNLGSTALR